MTKEEIKHFKSLLRQGSLRHMNILLDDKFQKELLTIIKDYEKLQQENQKYKEVIDRAIDFIVKETKTMPTNGCKIRLIELLDILKEVE
jgi:hypothetical protein